MPNNAKKVVYKKKEFEIYVLWKSLPAHMRGMKKQELESSGFSDPLILKIIKIKNQTEFAKYFHIKDLGTLSDWNNKIKKEKITSSLLMSNFEKESSSVNQKIILPNIERLEKKISEQNKKIYLLRKENIFLKNKFEEAKSNKVTIRKSKAPTPSKIIDVKKTKINISKPKSRENIFQDIINIFK